MMFLTDMLCGWNVSVSGILPSSLLCDESGADWGWTDCARCLLLWITGSGFNEPRVLKNWHISSAFSEKSVSSLQRRRSLKLIKTLPLRTKKYTKKPYMTLFPNKNYLLLPKISLSLLLELQSFILNLKFINLITQEDPLFPPTAALQNWFRSI